MATQRVTSPDGREWEVRSVRVRLPPWRETDIDPWGGETDIFSVLFTALIVMPFVLVVLPLARALIELPVAVARAAFSSNAWVEARCAYPAEIRILWRTPRKGAREVAGQVARQLEQGYEHLSPAGAEFVEMTKPPGLNLLESD